ncbi:hypothetical protein JTE90_019411 [Oedothorax gibbosus]|uniref:Lipocalin n=1 Tax=Oedothorax gibbosus TaxID=931172 RepID=A0AAV6TVW8_9ARAC|nr:hypothetical protein JTE90_019411 [Oedothorax gibbosus]
MKDTSPCAKTMLASKAFWSSKSTCIALKFIISAAFTAVQEHAEPITTLPIGFYHPTSTRSSQDKVKRLHFKDIYTVSENSDSQTSVTDSGNDDSNDRKKFSVNNVSFNDYIIVQVFYKRSICYYVANVTECFEDAYQTRFMSRCCDTKNKFVFSRECEATVKL